MSHNDSDSPEAPNPHPPESPSAADRDEVRKKKEAAVTGSRPGLTVQLPPLPTDRRGPTPDPTVRLSADQRDIEEPRDTAPGRLEDPRQPRYAGGPTVALESGEPEGATRITSQAPRKTSTPGAPVTRQVPHDGATVVSRPQGDAGTDLFSRPFSRGAGQGGASQASVSSQVSSLITPSGPLPVGDLVAGRYRVKKVLGVGGMGEVYHVTDEVLEIEVALKVMRSEVATDLSFLQRFRNELLVARQITHPHVVRIHDIGQDGSLLFMTMDLVEGRSLGDLMKERGSVEAPEAIRIVRQVADALGAAHRKTVVHRDLKPANILLDANGDAFVTDFGIARSHSFSGLTRTGEVLGTPDYLAPEQARGEEVDGRTDLYALGLIFFELVTGERPFTGGTLVEILAQHMTGQTRSFNDVAVTIDPGLQAVIRRCMEVTPDLRYPDAEALIADLDDLEKPRRRAADALRREKMGKAAKAGTVAAALLAVIGGGWWLWDSLKPIPTQEIVVPAETPVELQPLPSWLILPLPEDGTDGLSTADAWASWGVPQALSDIALESGRAQVIDRERLLRVMDNLELDPRRLTDADISLLKDQLKAQHVILGRLEPTGGGYSLSLETRGADGTAESLYAAQGEHPAELTLAAGRALAESLGTEPAPLGWLKGDAGKGAAEDPSAGDLFVTGQLLMERGDADAEQSLRAAVEADPTLAAGWLALAHLQRRQDRTSEAADSLGQSLRHLPAGTDGELLGFRARRLDALLNQDPEAAHRELERLVERLPGDTEARFQLAGSYGELGQIDRALETLEVLRRLDPTDSRVWYYLGRYSIISGDPGRAVDDYLVEALALARRSDDPTAEAQIANALGIGYQHLGKLEQASRRFEDAARLQERIGDQAGYAKALLNLGRLSSGMNQPDRAEEQLRTALATFEQLRDIGGQADAVNAIGVLRENQGSYAGALEEYRRALRLRLDSGQRLNAAESYHNIGFVHLQMANYIDAALNLEQALDIYAELGNTYGSMLVMQTRAGADIARGQWEQAAADLLAALATSRELQVPLAMAASHGDLARLYRLQGRYTDALSSLDKAIEIVDEQENIRGQVEFTLSRAQTLLALGKTPEVEPLLRRAQELLGETGNDAQRSQWFYLNGLWQKRQGETADAANSLSEARRLAESSRSVTAGLRARLAAASLSEPADVQALENLLGESRNLGHVPLELAASEAVARAYLRRNQPDAADDPLRRALGMVRKVGDYHRSHHLHELLAQVHRSRGNENGAAQALAAAKDNYQRTLASVPDDAKLEFENMQDSPELRGPATN